MKDEAKNSKKQNRSKNSKKVVINTKEDLNKLSFSILKNTDISDFSGEYYNFIYERALGIEKDPISKEALLSSSNYISTNKNNSKNAPQLKENSKTSKTVKTVKKPIKKPANNNTSNIQKKKEEKNDINNNYFGRENYNSYNYDNNDNNMDFANQSLPLPAIKYNQDMNIKKQLKIEYIVFQMRYNTRPGEDLGVIGSINELGIWDQNRALKLSWHEGNIWKTKINFNFSDNSMFEFKYIFIANGRVKQWEDGNNRKLVYNDLKEIIEPNIKEGYLVEFKNINGNNIIYNVKESTLMVVCEWNKK